MGFLWLNVCVFCLLDICKAAAASGDVLAGSSGSAVASDAQQGQRPGSGSTQPSLSAWRS